MNGLWVDQYVFQSTASSFVFGTAALLTKPGQTFAPLVGTFLLTKLANHNFKEVSDFATDKTVNVLTLHWDGKWSHRTTMLSTKQVTLHLLNLF